MQYIRSTWPAPYLSDVVSHDRNQLALDVHSLPVHLLSLFYDLRLTSRRLGWVTAGPSSLCYKPPLLGSSNPAPGSITWEASELRMHHSITVLHHILLVLRSARRLQ